MGAGEIERLKQLLKRPENRTCADCNTKQPRWASINLGCFICIRCSGIHRSIGVHVSKVRSVTLDDWQSAWVDNMERWGNKKVNQLYESKIGNNRKPDATASDRELEQYIRQKYEHKVFMSKRLAREPKTEKVSSEEESESEQDSGSGSNESDTSDEAEVIAISKVNVNSKSAKARDSRSSHPKQTKNDKDLTREFEKVAVSSGSEAFAEFSQAPTTKPASSSSATNTRNNGSMHDSQDFGQFSDFFGAESQPATNTANDKDFIMSLFQPGPANPPESAAAIFVSGPIPSVGPYMQTPANMPYNQVGVPQQIPYGQQGMPGITSTTATSPSMMFHPSNNIPMASFPTAPSSYVNHGPIAQTFGSIPPEMMPSYSQPMMNMAPMYGQQHQQASPSSISYGQQMPQQQTQWPQQNPYQ